MASWKLGKNQVMNITVCFKLSMWGFFCFLNKLAETYKIQDHSKKKKNLLEMSLIPWKLQKNKALNITARFKKCQMG